VYAYIVTTIKTTTDYQLIQEGSAPNFDGERITLCTCKHKDRATFRPLNDQDDPWKNRKTFSTAHSEETGAWDTLTLANSSKRISRLPDTQLERSERSSWVSARAREDSPRSALDALLGSGRHLVKNKSQ